MWFIATHSTPKVILLAEATKADETVQKVVELICSKEWAQVKEDPNKLDLNVSFSRVKKS